MTRIYAKDLPPIHQGPAVTDVLAVKLLWPLALLPACNNSGGKGNDKGADQTNPDDTGGNDDTGTGPGPDDFGYLQCNADAIEVDFNDLNDNGEFDYDEGERIHTVYLPGGCSIADAKTTLDTYGTGSGDIVLTGGDYDVYYGGVTVESGDDIDVSLQSDVDSATIIGLDTTAPIFSNSGSLSLLGDGKLKIQGFAANTAIESASGTVKVDGVAFDNLAVGLDIGSGSLTADDIRMTQTQDIGIHLYGNADATMTDIVMNNGLIGAGMQNAVKAEGAGHVDMQDVVVMNQQTSGSVIDIDAAYTLVIGLVALHNRTTEAIVDLAVGTEYENVNAQWSYFASSIIANNDYGERGALVVASEGDLVMHNVDVAYNYSDGAETVVDLSDTDNPYAGITTFTQCNVVGNTGLNIDGTPVQRSYITQEDIDNGYVVQTVDEETGELTPAVGDPTSFEPIEYNNFYDNGEARYEDLEDNNYEESLWSGDSPDANVIMYNPDEDSEFHDSAFRITNQNLLNSGNPNAQYPDYDGYDYPDDYEVPSTNTGGSITAFGGPVGNILESAVTLAYDEYVLNGE